MSINVYAWPCVGLLGWEWTVEDPIQRSASIITGAEYISSAQRRRRLVRLDVSSYSAGRMGAGFMESLKVLLEGGRHAVRLNSVQINPRGGLPDDVRQSARLEWTAGGVNLDWTSGGAELLWYSGTVLTGNTGTDAAGWPIITVTGLPANALVAKPSEFLTIYADASDIEGTVYRVLAPSYSDGSGVAVIRLHDDPGVLTGARVNLGTHDTGVFRPVSMPRVMRPRFGDWTYSWEYREVFEDEVGGFVELNPWT